MSLDLFGTILVTVEIRNAAGTVARYYSSRAYTSGTGTGAVGSPNLEQFIPRISGDVEVTRSIGTHFWNEKPRGVNSFSVIDFANGDGALNDLPTFAPRDCVVIIKRSNLTTAAYGSFNQMAKMVVEKWDTTDNNRLRLHVRDLSALLDRPLQRSLYPTDHQNTALRNATRPLTIGKAFQVPLQRVYEHGFFRADVHDSHDFIGITQVLVDGVPLAPGEQYTRGPSYPLEPHYGVRITNAAAQSTYAANVEGAFLIATDQPTQFSLGAGEGWGLTSWTAGVPTGWTKTGDDGATRIIAGRNLILQPQAADVWALANVTVTANTIANPVNGTVNADFIKETAVTNLHYAVINQVYNTSGVTPKPPLEGDIYTFSIYVRANGRTLFTLDVEKYDTLISYAQVMVDLAAATVTSVASIPVIQSSITSVGSSWYLVKFSFKLGKTLPVMPITAITARVILYQSAGVTSYLGDVTKGIYVYGAQLQRQTLANAQSYVDNGNHTAVVFTNGSAQLYLQRDYGNTWLWDPIGFYRLKLGVQSMNQGPTTTRSLVGVRTGAASVPRQFEITDKGDYAYCIQPNNAAGGNLQLQLGADISGTGAALEFYIDRIRTDKVKLAESLYDVIRYIATTDGIGPLSSSTDLSAQVSTLSNTLGYKFGFHVPSNEPTTIAEALDWICQSIGGYWYFDYSGKLVVDRLVAPSSTTITFNADRILGAVVREFDDAAGFSNRILAQRNYVVFADDKISPSAKDIKMVSADPDVTVTNGFEVNCANLGGARSSIPWYGECTYFEVTLQTSNGAEIVGYGRAIGANQYPGGIFGSTGYIAGAAQQYEDAVVTASPAAIGSFSLTNTICFAHDNRPNARECALWGTAMPTTIGARATTRSPHSGSRVYARKLNNGTAAGIAAATWTPQTPDIDISSVAVAKDNMGMGMTEYVMVASGGGATPISNFVVNLGQSPFIGTPPAEFYGPVQQVQLMQRPYRTEYQSTVSVASAYNFANAAPSEARSLDNSAKINSGTPTVLSRRANAVTECDRWATLFSVERNFYTFEAAWSDSYGFSLTHGSQFGLTDSEIGVSAKPLLAKSVTINLTRNLLKITGWG